MMSFLLLFSRPFRSLHCFCHLCYLSYRSRLYHLPKIPLALALFLCVLGGCTKKQKGSSSVRRGNVFVQSTVEPATLHPITSTDVYASRVHSYTMDSLLIRNIDTYAWEPALAKSYKISPDKKIFTFELRQNAFFHDGKPVTAEDVKFSFDAIFEPKYNAAHMRPYYSGIKKVEIIHPHKVRFIVKDTYFKNFDISAGLTVLPKHIYQDVEKSKKMNQEVIGSGPYRLKKYETGRRLILEKVPNWYGYKEKHLSQQYRFQEIVLRFIKDKNISLKMLEKRELDFLGLSPEDFSIKTSGKNWGKKVFKFKVENARPKGYSYIGWNLNHPIFKDRNIRLGLAHLFNRPAMNKKFRYNMSLLMAGPIYPQSAYADPSIKPIAFDMKKGLAYLKKSGWTDSDKDGVLDKQIEGKKRPFRFTLSYANKESEKYWVFYQQDLKKAGIDLQLRFMEWNVFIKKLDEAGFDAVALGWGGGSVEWDPKQIWHSSSAVKGGSNFIGYKNKDVDKWIDTARQEYDKKKRISILKNVYKQIAQDAPYIFLFSEKYDLYANLQRIQKPKDTFKYDVGIPYWHTNDRNERRAQK